MEHIDITFPGKLKRELDQQAKREHMGRSTLIQKAVRFYLYIKKQKSMKKLLWEGYQKIYGESEQILCDFGKLDRESMKYLD